MKINIAVTDIINDVTYSRKSVNTRVVITLLLHDVIHWKTATSYDKTRSVYKICVNNNTEGVLGIAYA